MGVQSEGNTLVSGSCVVQDRSRASRPLRLQARGMAPADLLLRSSSSHYRLVHRLHSEEREAPGIDAVGRGGAVEMWLLLYERGRASFRFA